MFDQERRSEKRAVSDIRASIRGARPKRFACSIKNVSRGGAKILIGADWILPARFQITGLENFWTTLGCQLIWRKGDFVGVKFARRLQ